MHVRHLFLLAIVAALVACGSPPSCFAAGPFGVDQISLKSGRTLRGAVLGRQADDSLLLAVSREWLQKSQPPEFDRQSELQMETQRRAWSQSKDRIEQQLSQPNLKAALASYFKQEVQRIDQQLKLDKPAETRFFLLELNPKHVVRTVIAPPERRKVAWLAWREHITGVETRSVTELQKDLKAAAIDLDGPPADLSDLLPVRDQSDEEWSARLAITQYTLDGGVDFQGKGNVLVRTSGVPVIPLFVVLPKLLAGEAEALLGDLLNPGGAGGGLGGGVVPGSPALPGFGSAPQTQEEALKAAIAEVEQHGHTGFRVTWLDTNLDRLMVTVKTQFIAKLSEGNWQPIWQQIELADGSVPRPQLEAEIWGNPEVKKLLEPLDGLGLEATLQKAIRYGAAAMSAQKAADGQFFQFRDRYAKRLDGPVLLLPTPPEVTKKK